MVPVSVIRGSDAHTAKQEGRRWDTHSLLVVIYVVFRSPYSHASPNSVVFRRNWRVKPLQLYKSSASEQLNRDPLYWIQGLLDIRVVERETGCNVEHLQGQTEHYKMVDMSQRLS